MATRQLRWYCYLLGLVVAGSLAACSGPKAAGPGSDSGTFDYFTLAIVGTETSSRGDYTKSEDDSVTEHGVAGEPNALGYFGYAYYEANKDELKVIAVDNGHGSVAPSAQTVANGTYQPLSRPLFLDVSIAAAARPEVKAHAEPRLATNR